ncbi:hypothetical protein BVY00_02190 [bacterium G20]|nr:hypothetical protein BVY00_02190 [bacterium G20]
MFGSNDQNPNSDAQAAAAVPTPSDSSPAMPPATEPSTTTVPTADVTASAPSAPTLADPMVTPSAPPTGGMGNVSMENAYIESGAQIGSAKPSEPETTPTAASIISTPPTPSVDPAAVDPDLAQIKQQALQSLEPLVGQLDQAPDEKFKTLMMLIQASDNSKMLKEAYEAANQITDEKARAQALLDVVNEVNYFAAQAKAKQ